METEDIIRHIRQIPGTHRIDCSILVAASENENVVAYWRPAEGKILLLHAGALLPHCRGWLELSRSDTGSVVVHLIEPGEVSNGTPLTALVADSYPHPEEDWGAIAPPGYDRWLATAPEPERQSVMMAWGEYETFYRENEPFRSAGREVFAVVGGWGLYLYEGEWNEHPDSLSVFFTLADAEPHYSVRQTVEGELILKELIT